MRPTEVIRALAALIPTQRPIYIWGSPGVGKSSLVKQAASTLGLELVDVRATLLDPVELRGIPCIHGDVAVWCPPAFLPQDGQGILFLDELALAPPLVQAACLQLTLDRRVGEYELPDGWSVIAASNRVEDRAGTHRLISPLLNRFVHLNLQQFQSTEHRRHRLRHSTTHAPVQSATHSVEQTFPLGGPSDPRPHAHRPRHGGDLNMNDSQAVPVQALHLDERVFPPNK